MFINEHFYKECLLIIYALNSINLLFSFQLFKGEFAMDKYPDLRISRTMLAIRNAFAELIQEKGFENLSVKDITTKANINRGTFYLHFKDKFDLLNQIEKEILDELENIAKKVWLIHNDGFSKFTDSLPVISEIFEYFSKNAGLMNSILSLKGSNSFELRFKEVIRHNLCENYFYQKNIKANLEIPHEYFITYITSIYLGILEEWLARGCSETPEEMSLIFSKLIFQAPFSAMGMQTKI